jgi:hypothetical protein
MPQLSEEKVATMSIDIDISVQPLSESLTAVFLQHWSVSSRKIAWVNGENVEVSSTCFVFRSC